MMADLWICDLGLVPYGEALALQHGCARRARPSAIPDTLLLLEHPPVYTRGRRRATTSCRRRAPFAGRAIEVVEVDRGGRVTYHGPGQLVGYPIMRIGDIIGYLRTLERAIIATLGREGVAAHGGGERPTGVWAGGRKIASIGVHVRAASRRTASPSTPTTTSTPFGGSCPCGLPGVRDDLGRARDGPRAARSTACARASRRARARARPAPRSVAPERLMPRRSPRR